jgi:hypothetical protein
MKKAEKGKLERTFNSYFEEVYNIYAAGNFMGLSPLRFTLDFE